MSLIHRAVRAYGSAAGLIDRLQSLFAFVLRLYVGRVFFASGLIKLSNWDATLALFANEYHVPVLSPHLAAILGTAAEVGLPVFLVLGLGTRFMAVPSMEMVPEVGSSSPAMSRSVVVFPQPDGPTSTRSSPSAMKRFRSETA